MGALAYVIAKVADGMATGAMCFMEGPFPYI